MQFPTFEKIHEMALTAKGTFQRKEFWEKINRRDLRRGKCRKENERRSGDLYGLPDGQVCVRWTTRQGRERRGLHLSPDTCESQLRSAGLAQGTEEGAGL